jgi:hypothetical protein
MAVTDRRTGVGRAAAPGGPAEPPLFVSPTATPGDPAEAPVFVPWAGPVLRLLGVYAVVRVVLLLADVLSAHLAYGGDLNGPLRSWDSHLYLQVAAHGYPAVAPLLNGHYTYSTAAFEPVFPALVAIVTFAAVPPVAAAVVVSMVCGALATVLVWRLALELTDHATAWRSAVLFAVFPGMGVAWGLLYSECVGLALAAWCLLLMLRRRWLAAGVVGLLATATSPMALPLALAALVPVVQSLRRHRFPGAIVTVVLVPLGFLGFAAWLGCGTTTPSTGGTSSARRGGRRSISGAPCSASSPTCGATATRGRGGWSGSASWPSPGPGWLCGGPASPPW